MLLYLCMCDTCATSARSYTILRSNLYMIKDETARKLKNNGRTGLFAISAIKRLDLTNRKFIWVLRASQPRFGSFDEFSTFLSFRSVNTTLCTKYDGKTFMPYLWGLEACCPNLYGYISAEFHEKWILSAIKGIEHCNSKISYLARKVSCSGRSNGTSNFSAFSIEPIGISYFPV